MGAMNRNMNLPQIQRIMHEFEKESATMDMKEEMMSEAVDDVMDDELEDEEEEGDKILKEVLDEIGVNLSQQVCRLLAVARSDSRSVPQLTDAPSGIASAAPLANQRQAIAEGAGPAPAAPSGGPPAAVNKGPMSDEDELQARLDNLRKG